MTNAMVFIFCLWLGGANDPIIVLSAQHSFPISIRKKKGSAAGYPCFGDLTRTLPVHTHLRKQKDSVAVVVKGSREKNAPGRSVFIALILSSTICYVILSARAPTKMLPGLIPSLRQLCAIVGMPAD